MPVLFDRIRRLVKNGRYVISEHAAERLTERGVLEWQAVDGVERGKLIAEKPKAKPNPVVEIRQSLADGTEIKAVWAYLISVDVAKLVTVHFFNK